MRHRMRQKTRGVALSLLGGWTADDEEDANETETKTHNKTNKKNQNHSTQLAQDPKANKLKSYATHLGPNRYRREMIMCASEEENKPNKMQQKTNRHHVIVQHVHTTASRSRNEDMNFCVDMVKCTVCMSVYDYICRHYMEGGYRVVLSS